MQDEDILIVRWHKTENSPDFQAKRAAAAREEKEGGGAVHYYKKC